MFKKALKQLEEEEKVVDVKDRKKLKQTLHKQFDEASVDKLFEYVDVFRIAKLEKSKAVLYMDGKDAMIVDSSGNGDYFPTVYCLSLLPQFVKIVFKVSTLEELLKYKNQVPWSAVLNMKEIKDFQADEVVAIQVSSGQVVAVGATAMSKTEYEQGKDSSEVAAFLIHFQGDNLFLHCTQKLKNVIYPISEKPEAKKEKPKKKEEEDDDNDGDADLLAFYKQSNKNKSSLNVQVPVNTNKTSLTAKPLPKQHDKKKQDDSDEDEKPKKANQKAHKEAKNKQEVDDDNKKDKKKADKKTDKHSKNNEQNSEDEKKGKDKKNKTEEKEKGKKKHHKNEEIQESKNDEEIEETKPSKHEKKQTEDNEKTESAPLKSKKEVDQLIMEAFLNAVVLTVDDGELPMENKDFWTKFVLPCRSCSETIDIKHSSYGNLTKFYQYLMNQKMIEYKEAGKKGKVNEIVKIYREHKKIENHEPTVSHPDHRENEDAKDDNVKLEITKEVMNLYKIPVALKHYFTKFINDEYVLRDDFERQLRDFLKKHDLLKKDTVYVKNELESDFNFTDDEAVEGGVHPKQPQAEHSGDEEDKTAKDKKKKIITLDLENLVDKFLEKVTKWFKTKELKGVNEKFIAGTFDGIQIFAEKIHGKNATRILGFEFFGIDAVQIFNYFKSKFETTGEIHDISLFKEKVKEITLHGLFADDIKDYLTIELKVPENMISLLDKLALKKNKKGPMNHA